MAGILQIAMNDRTTGRGAGALLVHRALLRAGEASELWVFEQTTAEPGVYSLTGEDAESVRLRIVREQELGRMLHGRRITEFRRIYIHGLGRSIPPALLTVLTQTNVCWLLDDCAPYTAGCSHSAHCMNWRLDNHKECADCPACAGNVQQQHNQVETYRLKRRIYQALPKHRLTFLCQNTWQQEQAAHSIAKSVDTVVCPRLLDDGLFHPGSREDARRSLGLPERAFVLLLPTDLSEGRERVLRYVQNTLRQLRRLYTGYVVLVSFGREPLRGDWPVDGLRSVDLGAEPSLLPVYYRAANLQLWFAGIDSAYVRVREAGLCGLPSVVFDMGASRSVLAAESGFAVAPFAETALTKVLLAGMRDDSSLREVGMKLYTRLHAEQCWQEQGLPQPAEDAGYAALYAGGSMQIRFFLQHELDRRWPEKETDTKEQKQEKQTQRAAFIDRFCRGWLRTVPLADAEAVWRFVEVWLNHRSKEDLSRFGSQQSLLEHIALCRELRAALIRYFQQLPLEQFACLPQMYIDVGIKLWNFIFLNVESALVRSEDRFACPPELLQSEGIYPKYLIWSMFVPYVPQKIDLRMQTLVTNGDLPIMLRVILSFWLISAPFFGGTPEERRTILSYIEETCRFLMEQPDFVADNLRELMMEKLMVSLWRISYLGGNNIQALHAYGDYLQSLMRRQYPEYAEPLPPRRRQPGERLRIGYVSLNFRRQAVSQYMANRLKYHDRRNFFVKTFILEKNPADEMTERIREWSDESVTLPTKSFAVLREAAKAIRESELDLVIYGDIGMDNITYQLGAMHLAPVQAVLVGHGTTTGLSSIDYYISGDHEPANAQEHYVEQLIRLPHAGAAQLPPQQTDKVLSRADYGIPEDAVVFISCANGLKHIPERDALLAEILQKAPNAYILLKPYMTLSLMDAKFTNRLMAAAQRVGAGDRMKIAPPLPRAGDLMAFLQLGDIQLDTYPYGGWTTNLEALYYHLPIITQQGDIARSRWGAGLLQAMGIEEGIAQDAQGYVDWAVRFAREPELRERVSARIAEMAPQVLFNGEAAQPSYEQALRQMIEQKEKRAKKMTKHKNKKHS